MSYISDKFPPFTVFHPHLLRKNGELPQNLKISRQTGSFANTLYNQGRSPSETFSEGKYITHSEGMNITARKGNITHSEAMNITS